MPKKISPASKTIKAKSSSPKKTIQKTDVSKIRALEEQLAQRDVEIARLSTDNQRLLKETEQRATELQIINNIGQTLTEGLDLNSMIERVAERLHEVLKVDNIGITIINPNTGQVISQNNIFHSTDPSFATDRFSLDKFKSLMRLSARGGNRSWVMNTNAEKSWRKYAGNLLEGDRTPKSFVALPLLVGKNANGGIIFADYEKENAFIDLPIRMLETIAYNMGTGIQNVLLFDETQRLLNETEQRNTELTMLSIVQQALSSHLDFKAIYEAVGRKLIEIFRVQAASIYTIDLESRIITYEYAFEPTSERELGQRPATGLHNYVIDQIIASRKSFVLNSGFDELVSSFTDSGASRRIKPKSLCVTPILFQKNTLMAVSLHNIETENFFDNSAVRLLETISNATGVALENARLFEETQRLLDETEQRATELQIINNIGQTLTEGGDLESMIQRVGERIQEALNVNNIIISIFDKETERIIANYMVRNGEQTTLSKEDFNMHAIKILMRASARRGGISWVIKDDEVEKFWHRWRGSIGDDVPKSVVVLPLLAGREVIGGITLADYEKENAFTDLSLNLLETIASNMGTAVQNVRLFDETQHLFKEAEESRATAERANKAKSTFLANMSHELRTPLNAIMGFTSIVRDKSQGVLPEKQINNLEKVLASSQHLLGLINTVLDLAKIEAGRMDVIPAKFNINVLIDLCGNLAAPLLKPNVPLVKQVDETIGIVYSDQDKIKQILLNLLSNAAKFTHEGRVLLSVEKPDPETVNISVTDSGIGIKADAIDRVFEEFQQADATTTRQYGGTGLGLPISRSLARLLGGDLTATSELGKGSTFTLTIPTKYGGIPAASANPTPGAVQPAESLTQAGSSHP